MYMYMCLCIVHGCELYLSTSFPAIGSCIVLFALQDDLVHNTISVFIPVSQRL